MLKIIAQRKPSTLKPGTSLSANIIKSAFITKVKRPRVMIVTGKVSKTKIGFKNALNIPITRAAIKAEVKLSTLTPGSIYAAAKTAKALNIQLIKTLLAIYF